MDLRGMWKTRAQMPIEFWQAKTGWFWTARSDNGKVIADSAEIYSSRAKAVQGAKATATEFFHWQLESTEPRWHPKATTARQKRVGKGSTSLSSQIRKTGKRGG